MALWRRSRKQRKKEGGGGKGKIRLKAMVQGSWTSVAMDAMAGWFTVLWVGE